MAETRVDSWLWAIRIYKSRTDATTACRGGHVRINGRPAKPAARLKVGDRVTARVHSLDRDLEVVELIEKRVGATVALNCYVDHSPPPPDPVGPAPVKRERGAGRPTKRDRRQMDRLRGFDR